MPERRTLRSRNSLTSQMKPTKAVAFMSRPRRGVPETQSVTVARATSESPDESKKSIRLTVKMPSSKLREATSGSRRNVAVNSRDAFEGVEIMSGPRGSRAKRTIVEESESEEEEEEESAASDDEQQDEDDEEQDDDGEEEDEDEEAEEDSADADADADGDADVDADGDIVMDDEASLPPPPVIKLTGSASKPSLTVTPAQESKVKSVEAKEMELADDDDEELSELDSEAEAEEGENAENEEAAEIDEMDQDDESRSVGTGSRASTPDVSKMTKRQRSRLDQVMGSDFLQLPMGMLYSTSGSTILLIFSLQSNIKVSNSSHLFQNPKSRSISLQKNTPCAERKWLDGGKT